MNKWWVILFLFALYAAYSFWIYRDGTQSKLSFPAPQQALIDEGKQLYQQYNCAACHQLYGLGGYLGPELTTAYSDKGRGEGYMRALLISGGQRMPNFHFSNTQVDALIAYLKYVDTTATPVKAAAYR